MARTKRKNVFDSDSILWKILPLLFGLLTLATPIVNWRLRLLPAPQPPQKKLELNDIGPLNPIAVPSLKDGGAISTFSLKIGNDTYDNIFLDYAFFTNSGIVPILPTDFTENLSVSVSPPWKIVAVKNGGGVQCQWQQITDQKYEAKPTLLNPEDRFNVLVYITKTTPMDDTKPEVKWDARIVNLKQIIHTQPTTPSSRIMQRQNETIFGMFLTVELWGYAVWFTLGFFLIFEAITLTLLARASRLAVWNWGTMAKTLLCSLVAICAAESLATYVYGTVLTDILGGGADNWLNLPPILVQVGLLVYLTFARKPNRKSLPKVTVPNEA